MRESERRIRAYQAVLPRMKERVIAAVSLLAVALTTMVSATYAWLVLSQNPEVTGLQTTIAANGNLEIALAGRLNEYGELLPPADSTAVDGALALPEKNITWGNLVNLGDTSYALDKIVLRPAELNTGDLQTVPLIAAKYGEDGRVEDLISNFEYTYAYGNVFKTEQQVLKEMGDKKEDITKFRKYGVRAVSSIKYSFSEDTSARDKELAALLSAAEVSVGDARATMSNLTAKNTESLAALQGLMNLAGRYLSSEVDEVLGEPTRNTPVQPAELENILFLFDQMLLVCEKSANAMADIYNFEIYQRSDSKRSFVTGTFLLTATDDELKGKLEEKNNKGELLIKTEASTQLNQLRSDYKWLTDNKAGLIADCKDENGNVRNGIVYANATNAEDVIPISHRLSKVFDVNSVLIDGETIDDLRKRVSADKSQAISLLSGTKQVQIASGILPNLDQFTGAQIKTPANDPLQIPVDCQGKVNVPILGLISVPKISLKANVSTTAAPPWVLESEFKRAKSGTTIFKGDTAQAAETYGLALDFWVRTNASHSKLTLEGAPVYAEREETVKVTVNGSAKELYKLVLYTDQSGNTREVEAYIQGTKFWEFNRSSGLPVGEVCDVTSNAVKEYTLIKEMVEYLAGYGGVNRVWEDMNDASIYGNSTTMGSGSCYVFYPQSADDQTMSIELLSNLKIAFIDQNGSLLGSARMDTAHVIEQAGKVTVPLVCDSNNNSITMYNSEGVAEEIFYITDLPANTPTLVTALVYLDGKNLSNEQVLATNDIQGHLNIQFGTTADLSSMDDPTLRDERCKVEAEMWNSATDQTLSADDDIVDGVRTKFISVNVEGVKPSRVTAYFQRVINSTQGIRQKEIVFTDQGNGVWTANYTFESAGDYVLREVLLDGVAYELDSPPISYTLHGYRINSLAFGEGYTASKTYDDLLSGATYVTTERRFTADVLLDFSKSDGDPITIKGVFIHQKTGNRVTITFKREVDTLYRGSATFAVSGEYCLERLEVDNMPIGVPEEDILSIHLQLGVTANVYANATQFAYSGKTIKPQMSMTVVGDDNIGFENLPPIQLKYSRDGLTSDAETAVAWLEWNRLSQQYEGEFEITRPGTYMFMWAEVVINGNTNIISKVRTAPTLTVSSDTPPVFVSTDNLGGSVFAMNGDASFSVTIQSEGGVVMDAKVVPATQTYGVDDKAHAYYIRGTSQNNEDGTYTFSFVLPRVGEQLSQDGAWMLEELYLTNVCDENGKMYYGRTENGPIAVGDENPDGRQPYTIADGYYDRWWAWGHDALGGGDSSIFTITVSSSTEAHFIDEDAIVVMGKTGNDVTTAFGTTVTPEGIKVAITANGQPLGEGMSVSNITIVYELDVRNSFDPYNNNTMYKSNLGGNYRFSQGDLKYVVGLGEKMELTFGGAVDGIRVIEQEDGTYLLQPQAVLKAAGMYVAKSFSYTIVSETGSLTKSASYDKAPRYDLYTKNPTATITKIDAGPHKQWWKTTETDTSKNPNFTQQDDSTLTSSYDGHTATLYPQAEKNGDHAQFKLPKLTITVAAPAGYTASLTLPANNELPALEFSGTGALTQPLGKIEAQKTWTVSGGCGSNTNYNLYKYKGYGSVRI